MWAQRPFAACISADCWAVIPAAEAEVAQKIRARIDKNRINHLLKNNEILPLRKCLPWGAMPNEGGPSAITSHRPFYPSEKKARVKSLKRRTAKEIKPEGWKVSAEFNAKAAAGARGGLEAREDPKKDIADVPSPRYFLGRNPP